MSKSPIERRLTDVSRRLAAAREELAVLDEQLVVFNDAADEARIRALVSESALAEREHHEAQKHAVAMARSREALIETIAQLGRQQDELLERLPLGSG